MGVISQYHIQSYPDTLGTPGTGVIISVRSYLVRVCARVTYPLLLPRSVQDVNFIGAETTIAVNSGAEMVAVNCGAGSCTGKQHLKLEYEDIW